MPNKEVKYKFSSANLACLGVVLLCLVNQALELIPTHFLWQKITLWALYIAMLIVSIVKFPIFIKIKKEKELYHNDILSKKLGFLSKLFSGIFIFEQASDFVSFFSDRTFIYDRENNNFLIKNGETKFVHRVYDVIFGVSFGVFMQFLYSIKSAYVINLLWCGLICVTLLCKPIILDYIYSINIKNDGDYNVFVVHNYGPVYDTVNCFLKNFCIYISKRNIFINKKLIDVGEPVITYVIEYQKENLSRFSRLKNLYIFIFPIVVFFLPLFYASQSIGMGSLMSTINAMTLSYGLLFVLNLIFLSSFIVKKREKTIDKNIVQKLGKSTVLQALETMQNIDVNYDSSRDFALPIYKKIEYVKNL